MVRQRSSKPPPPPGHGPRHRRDHHGSSPVRASDVVDLLEPWIANEEDRAFVARCIATEGPIHHRVSSIALLRLLARALEAAGGPPQSASPETLPVRFRLPPHLERDADEDAHYPIRLPLRALELLVPATSAEAKSIAEALTDGPAHHALANVAMVCMLDALIERLAKKGGP